ncbi:DUF1552 domain-containing protein [Caulobacter sp. UNC279MFTsu5.1]|uniref:DUF1552 domain-containing protein n=1 Tax=Caulobacter sp. UNC279MFTsu5.1 TaxID=1502775 RepID=UPI0003A041B7|nr:DUF1552 domain-containing protein [Caulobacter sp. UNC279MFTsu5.1]SFK67626.1 Protein of unknown function [Caulobacter sp. UNC279MFTsu5.1]
MAIFRGALPRRTMLRGATAAVALPFLQAMAPLSASAAARGRPRKPRLLAIEMVHGAGGSTAYGRSRNLWSPENEGRGFAFTPSLAALAPFRQQVTIVSNTELRPAGSLSPDEDGDGVDHARSSAAFLTGAHPVRNVEGKVHAGPSIDQIFARSLRGKTRIGSLELTVEDLGEPPDPIWPQGYSPSYRHAISWIDARTPAMPEVSPGKVFASLFGAVPGSAAQGASVLDAVIDPVRKLHGDLAGEDRHRLAAHLQDIRDLERSIRDFESVKQGAASGETGDPPSFPDHVRILGDLIRLAFAGDLTRVATLKLGLDRSQRIYPESGVMTPFHTASHHRQEPERIEAFTRLNAFHVAQIADLIGRFDRTGDGEASLLQRSLVLYGSPMGDSHIHAHSHLPVFLAGRADGAMEGGRHVVCAPGTPFSNLLRTIIALLDVPVKQIGDSDGFAPV